jgi:hypothetical protein
VEIEDFKRACKRALQLKEADPEGLDEAFAFRACVLENISIEWAGVINLALYWDGDFGSWCESTKEDAEATLASLKEDDPSIS